MMEPVVLLQSSLQYNLRIQVQKHWPLYFTWVRELTYPSLPICSVLSKTHKTVLLLFLSINFHDPYLLLWFEYLDHNIPGLTSWHPPPIVSWCTFITSFQSPLTSLAVFNYISFHLSDLLTHLHFSYISGHHHFSYLLLCHDLGL